MFMSVRRKDYSSKVNSNSHILESSREIGNFIAFFSMVGVSISLHLRINFVGGLFPTVNCEDKKEN
jgi:hypothetical protein